jgi:hypothetical protein
MYSTIVHCTWSPFRVESGLCCCFGPEVVSPGHAQLRRVFFFSIKCCNLVYRASGQYIMSMHTQHSFERETKRGGKGVSPRSAPRSKKEHLEVLLIAVDGSRTRFLCLEGKDNSRYTTTADSCKPRRRMSTGPPSSSRPGKGRGQAKPPRELVLPPPLVPLAFLSSVAWREGATLQGKRASAFVSDRLTKSPRIKLPERDTRLRERTPTCKSNDNTVRKVCAPRCQSSGVTLVAGMGPAGRAPATGPRRTLFLLPEMRCKYSARLRYTLRTA